MLNKPFLNKVSCFIEDNHLLNKGEKCLVALSGGADSVALTLVMRQLGYNVEAAHCNFHLRGEESDRDERFCVEFCKTNGVPLHIAHFDTVSFARLRKISIEMAARNLRYSYFRQLLKDIAAVSVCVAHHRDDSVETVLMNLIRGTGIHGLTGISPKNGDVVRPLLCVSRQEIEDVLRLAGQDYVTDSTNLVDDVVRNKIRLDILPLMKQINPSVAEGIAKTAKRVDEVAEVFDDVVARAADGAVTSNDNGVLTLSISAIKASPCPEHVLFCILKDYKFTSSQVEQIYRTACSEPGKEFISPSHRLLIDRGSIIIEPHDDGADRRIVIPEDGLYVYDDNTKFRVERCGMVPVEELRKSSDHAYADLSKVSFPLTVRRVMPGDRFVPFGMKGSRLVSDYLTDRKVNLFEKRRQLVVEDFAGKIIWLVGRRGDNRCRVTEATTSVLSITFIRP